MHCWPAPYSASCALLGARLLVMVAVVPVSSWVLGGVQETPPSLTVTGGEGAFTGGGAAARHLRRRAWWWGLTTQPSLVVLAAAYACSPVVGAAWPVAPAPMATAAAAATAAGATAAAVANTRVLCLLLQLAEWRWRGAGTCRQRAGRQAPPCWAAI